MKPSIIPADTADKPTQRESALTRLAKPLLLSQLRKIRDGRLRLIDSDSTESFGAVTAAAPFEVTIRVRSPRFYPEVVFGGTLGSGEAYMNGYWQCDNLTGLVRLMVINRDLMNDVDSGWSAVSAPLLKLAHWLNRNDKLGSRRNIAAHYDLGNRFFALFLDETMAYSCGIFERADASLLRGVHREIRRRLQQARLETRSAPVGNRHRLGRPRHSCRPPLRMPRHHHDHLARTVRVRARSAWRAPA